MRHSVIFFYFLLKYFSLYVLEKIYHLYNFVTDIFYSVLIFSILGCFLGFVFFFVFFVFFAGGCSVVSPLELLQKAWKKKIYMRITQVCCFEQILEAFLCKRADVQPLTSHCINYSSKMKKMLDTAGIVCTNS